MTAETPQDPVVNRTSRRQVTIIGLLVIAIIGATIAVTMRRGNESCAPEVSAARTWNDALLDAIRRDFPAPTVHSRNLYHLSAATWDVWAAYDDKATGIFVDEDRTTDDTEAARAEAISYAAHRLLSARYADSVGADDSLAQFDRTMSDLCLDLDGDLDPESPAAFGVRVADTILTESRDDGSLEASGYVDLSYVPVNAPMIVDESGTEMIDPNRWQPLSLSVQLTQNGQRIDAGVQEFIGPNWGYVTPFAIEADSPDGLPYDPGPPPFYETEPAEFAAAASDVVVFSSHLDGSTGETIDISPAAIGNTALGTYDAIGWEANPVTGEPYAENTVQHADFGRIIAEYWADGPDSETPPGHWNALANDVGDVLQATEGLVLDGRTVNRLEWDAKVGIALNGALHDSAIAAWGAKNFYDYARPISMIRYLGQRGELDERPGVIETITSESSEAGERHENLRDHIGEQAVYSWLGEPINPAAMLGGVGWIRAADWVPYQRSSFVTPSFAGYVSGHSAFSRAAAEVLTALTGSEFFPGGLATHTVERGDLLHEAGPSSRVELQWATYRDAADQAGLSRLYGGIHVWPDDLNGRRMGAEIGDLAVERARVLYG